MIDRATRSRIMASVKSKNTAPELAVRSMAHRLGYRFRLCQKDLPGKPDLVFPSRRIAMFIHGCFWHGHDCPHGQRKPVTNADYWSSKIKGNVERDARVQQELNDLGWRIVTIWECQTTRLDLADTINSELNDGGLCI